MFSASEADTSFSVYRQILPQCKGSKHFPTGLPQRAFPQALDKPWFPRQPRDGSNNSPANSKALSWGDNFESKGISDLLHLFLGLPWRMVTAWPREKRTEMNSEESSSWPGLSSLYTYVSTVMNLRFPKPKTGRRTQAYLPQRVAWV